MLLAIVDASYNFLFADVGCQGKVSDGDVFANSIIKRKFEARSLNIPEAEVLRPLYSMSVPYVLQIRHSLSRIIVSGHSVDFHQKDLLSGLLIIDIQIRSDQSSSHRGKRIWNSQQSIQNAEKTDGTSPRKGSKSGTGSCLFTQLSKGTIFAFHILPCQPDGPHRK